jgi:SAM-dependent methyltransferase
MTWVEDEEGHVARVYGDDYFSDGGAGYPGYLDQGTLLSERGRWFAQLAASRLGGPGRVLEVGAAAGFTLGAFLDAGWQGVGIEPNARMSAYARRELGLDVRTGTLEELDEPGGFDLVLMLQVISHLIDPHVAIAKLAGLLSPGGSLLIETWNWRSLAARAFGSMWHQYSPPSVLQWFCPQSLARLMASHGLEQVASGRPRKRLGWKHARSLIGFKLGGSRLGRAFETVAKLGPDDLTLPYPFDDARWYLFRQAGARR